MGFKDLRYKSGYTQEEFIKFARISEETIRKLEKDHKEILNVSDDLILRLMDVFNCTIDDLLAPDEIKNKRIDYYNKKKLE